MKSPRRMRVNVAAKDRRRRAGARGEAITPNSESVLRDVADRLPEQNQSLSDTSESEEITEQDAQHGSEASGDEDRYSTDDGLTVYLKQMGSIPLLNRKQELELVTRLDTARAKRAGLQLRHRAP